MNIPRVQPLAGGLRRSAKCVVYYTGIQFEMADVKGGTFYEEGKSTGN